MDSSQYADSGENLAKLRKSDKRKVTVAMIVKAQTSVSNEWLANRLKMGHDRSMSRFIKTGKDEEELEKLRDKIFRKFPGNM